MLPFLHYFLFSTSKTQILLATKVRQSYRFIFIFIICLLLNDHLEPLKPIRMRTKPKLAKPNKVFPLPSLSYIKLALLVLFAVSMIIRETLTITSVRYLSFNTNLNTLTNYSQIHQQHDCSLFFLPLIVISSYGCSRYAFIDTILFIGDEKILFTLFMNILTTLTIILKIYLNTGLPSPFHLNVITIVIIHLKISNLVFVLKCISVALNLCKISILWIPILVIVISNDVAPISL